MDNLPQMITAIDKCQESLETLKKFIHIHSSDLSLLDITTRINAIHDNITSISDHTWADLVDIAESENEDIGKLIMVVNRLRADLQNELSYTKNNNTYKYKRLYKIKDDHKLVHKDMHSKIVFDHVNLAAASLVQRICNEAKAFIPSIQAIVKQQGYYTLEYTHFENPDNNIVLYENQTTGHVYRSYLSMGFSFRSNLYTTRVHQNEILFFRNHGLHLRFLSLKKNNIDGSTQSIIRFEKVY
jgi:hypothetical protein